MSDLFVEPAVVHRLAVALRFVDRFTATPVSERQEVHLVGHEWWRPVFREEDSSYRFVVTNREVPALGAVDVAVASARPDAVYRNRVAFQVTIPPPGPVPVPLTTAHYLVERPLWPTRTLPIPPRETALVGRLLRAGQPLADHRVLFEATGPPGPATPEAWTDEHGEFLFRLPDLRVRVNPIVTTANLQAEVTDGGGAPQVITAPVLPLNVPIGQVTQVTVTVN